MGAISTERLFSSSCIEGLRLVRVYAAKHPDCSLVELVQIVQKLEPDSTGLDLEASLHLHTIVEIDCPLEGHALYQQCIRAVVTRHQPLWAKAMRTGRRRFIKSLNSDDQDVFRGAGLMSEPPSSETVRWWDEVAGFARLFTDTEKMEQAREAERLSISYEIERLKKQNINESPKWPGLDDNFAGYDVLSYDRSEYGLVNRLIEVKSTVANPLQFFVTRNEWDTAEKAGSSYEFHVWDMAKSPPILHIKSVAQVVPHIPADNGKGNWSQVRIPVGI